MSLPTSQQRAARILIVDDSAVMRSLLRSVIETDRRLEVIGTAVDGASALRVLENLHPDLVLLDVEMPGMDGLSTLKQMRSRVTRVPVIMCSSLTQRGARVTIEALANGAADYVAKPSGQPSRDAAIQALAQDLVPKILALTSVRVGSAAVSVHPIFPPTAIPSILPVAHPSAYLSPAMIPVVATTVSNANAAAFQAAVVVIGVSTGGPAALDALLPSLPANFPLPVLIVQHMPELFTRMLAERLDDRCPMQVREAVSGEPVKAGTIYIAKGNWHMEVLSMERTSDRRTVRFPDRQRDRLASPVPVTPVVLRLNQEPPENHCRPAADVLFRSAVSVYGSGVLGVVLTGMGSDGLAGCRKIRERSGCVLAQDEATSAVWGMPAAVFHAGLAHKILPLPLIASEILRLTGRGQREASELRESAV